MIFPVYQLHCTAFYFLTVLHDFPIYYCIAFQVVGAKATLLGILLLLVDIL
jgi:hypothetical protein